MSPNKERILHNLFPNLYAGKNSFECRDGWYNLITALSMKLEPLIAKYEGDPDFKPRANQVKEKYGTLRFYINLGTEEMYDIISKAEKKSEITCEHCGEWGRLVKKNNWLYTVCALCEEKL